MMHPNNVFKLSFIMVNKIQNKQKDTRLFFTLLKTVWIGLFMCAFFYSVQLGMKIQDRNLIYSYNTVLSNDQDANIPTTVDANFLKASPAGIIPNSSSSQPALNLIDDRELELNDYFSDSFLLTKENFLKIPLKQVGIVEDACFAAIGKGRRNPNSKMVCVIRTSNPILISLRTLSSIKQIQATYILIKSHFTFL
jgi:hypothetical protein